MKSKFIFLALVLISGQAMAESLNCKVTGHIYGQNVDQEKVLEFPSPDSSKVVVYEDQLGNHIDVTRQNMKISANGVLPTYSVQVELYNINLVDRFLGPEAFSLPASHAYTGDRLNLRCKPIK